MSSFKRASHRGAAASMRLLTILASHAEAIIVDPTPAEITEARGRRPGRESHRIARSLVALGASAPVRA